MVKYGPRQCFICKREDMVLVALQVQAWDGTALTWIHIIDLTGPGWGQGTALERWQGPQ